MAQVGHEVDGEDDAEWCNATILKVKRTPKNLKATINSLCKDLKVEKKKDGSVYAAKIERAVKNSKHVMLFWESKLIHKLRGKTSVPGLYYIGTDNSVPN